MALLLPLISSGDPSSGMTVDGSVACFGCRISANCALRERFGRLDPSGLAITIEPLIPIVHLIADFDAPAFFIAMRDPPNRMPAFVHPLAPGLSSVPPKPPGLDNLMAASRPAITGPWKRLRARLDARAWPNLALFAIPDAGASRNEMPGDSRVYR